MIAVLVLAACLFPLAPYKVKIVIVYLSMGILMSLLGAILARGLVAAATWMAVGRSFWILPNVLSEVIVTIAQPPTDRRFDGIVMQMRHLPLFCSLSCFGAAT